MKKKFDHHTPSLLAAFITATAPHAFRLPFWILAWLILLWGYAYWGARKRRMVPPKRLLNVMTVIGLIGSVITYRGAFHSDTYVALLSVMSGLKMLEIYSHRDRMVALFLAYFMVITNLFFSDELIMTLYMVLSVFVTTAVMIHIHQPSAGLKEKSRLAGVIMLQALPLMIILFFLFPRVQGSILGITQRSGGGTGFSDSMSPGSFSSLAQNTDPAFRVKFEDKMPEPEKRYWRGIVLQVFDGRTWRPSAQKIPVVVPVQGQDKVSYTVTLEPYKNQWMFTLDMPVSTPPENSIMTTDYTLWSRHGISSRVVYKMTSCLTYNTGSQLHQWEKQAFQLPPQGNPEARKLALKWRSSLVSPRKIVDAALAFFRNNNFLYTLKPPLLGRNTVDDFLFKTRKGYCEHYASAFVFLMRAAGLPARIVGGYQGGELNPYGDYLIVRQSEAHAWAEVWFPQKGWTRIDPTMAVAPERVTRGMRDALSEEDLLGLISMPDLGAVTDILKAARLGWDSVNAYWTLWVMGYTQRDQSTLLEKLGIRTGEKWKTFLKAGLLAAALVFLFIIILVFRMNMRASRIKSDPLRELYDRFCKKLDKIGIAKQAGEGPLDYAQRVEETREDLGASVTEITKRYVQLRYGKERSKNDVKNLEILIKRFHPRPMKNRS